MVLVWICLPIGLLAIALAVGVVLVPSVRLRRRERAQHVIEGREAPAQPEGTQHFAVDVAPEAAGSAHHALRRHASQEPRLRDTHTGIERTPDDRQLLFSVGEDADNAAVDRVLSEIERDPAFHEVREVPAGRRRRRRSDPEGR
ncbi:MAG TPA: hypothetical protein VKT18_06160 [Acidimicrobiales bacterium]|nr:hypothetical protein [Acidimicrobiales bacterium]